MIRYVAIDGQDGCGKSTQARRLVECLIERGREVVHVREPGSTPFGERLRAALLDPTVGDIDPTSEALAFFAARRELLQAVIGPALRRGAVVVSERCFVSTWAYQCLAPADPGGRVAAELVETLTRAVHLEHRPDLVVVLDLPVELAEQRIAAGDRRDRIEERDRPFHRRVRDAFLAATEDGGWIAGFLAATGGRLARIDAGAAPAAVAAAVLAEVVDEVGR